VVPSIERQSAWLGRPRNGRCWPQAEVFAVLALIDVNEVKAEEVSQRLPLPIRPSATFAP
jgi:hypothetical protein